MAVLLISIVILCVTNSIFYTTATFHSDKQSNHLHENSQSDSSTLGINEQKQNYELRLHTQGHFRELKESIFSQTFGKHEMKQERYHLREDDDDDDEIPSLLLDTEIEVPPEFEGLNELLDGLVIKIPTFSIREDISNIVSFLDGVTKFMGSISLTISEMTCFGMSVKNVEASHRILNKSNISFAFEITGFTIDCDFDWAYRYGTKGNGDGSIRTKDSSLSASIIVNSDDYASLPPNRTYFESCEAQFNLIDMDYEGGISGFLINKFEDKLQGALEGALAGVFCEEMKVFGNITAQDIIETVSGLISPYLDEEPFEGIDPLSGQNSLLGLPLHFIDLDGNGTIEDTLMKAAFDIASSFGDIVNDPKDSSSQDIKINHIMRDQILDEKGMLIVLPPKDEDALFVYELNSTLIESEIRLKEVKIGGLNTMTQFDPLNIISSQTVQTRIGWEFLDVLLGFEIVSRIPTQPDSLIVQSSFIENTEFISMYSKVDESNLTVSFLGAFNENKLDSIQLGSILYKDHIMPCLLFTYYIAELTELGLFVGTYHPPNVTGLITAGIDKLIADFKDVFNLIYMGSIMTAMPHIFSTLIKNGTNTLIGDFVADSNNVCPRYNEHATGNVFINLQDLLLTPTDVMNVSIPDIMPYGEIIPLIKENIDNIVLGPDAINELVMRPMTRSQSNNTGIIVIPAQFFNITLGNFTFKAHGLRIENLDSFGTPSKFLDPQGEDPYTLHTDVEIGPLLGATRLSISVMDDDGRRQENELLISSQLGRTDILVSILMKIKEDNFLSFPLGARANFNCLLALFSSQFLNEDGLPGQNRTPSLSLISFKVSQLENIDFNVECVSCSSSGIQDVPDIVNMLKTSGILDALLSKSVVFGRDILEGEYMDTQIARRIEEGSRKCPHDPNYLGENGTEDKLYDALGIPVLSKDSIEFLVLASIMSIESIGAIYSLHIDSTPDPFIQDPLMGDAILESIGVEANSVFNISVTEELIGNRIKTMIEGKVEDSTITDGSVLGINDIIRSFLLDEERKLSIEPSNISLAIAGYEFTLVGVHIRGLDSFESINVYNIISIHTLQNHFMLDHIDIELAMLSRKSDGIIAETESEDISVTFSVRDIEVSAAFLLAFDKDILNTIQLGSMLHTSSILPCVASKAIAVNITQFQADIGSLENIDINGFISEATKYAITNATKLITGAYIREINTMLERFVRTELQDKIQQYIVESECKKIDIQGGSGFVDFRDLFLDPNEAAEYGAMGNQPYGDLPMIVMNLIKNTFLSPDENNLPLINQVIIEPLTMGQSNHSGVILFPGELFGVGNPGEIGFRISDLRVDNLNAIGFPLQFLNPSQINPQNFQNDLTVGVGGKPLQISTKIFISSDELSLNVELNNVSILSFIQAKIDELSLLEFPLKEMTNLNCWLATIPSPILNEFGLRPDSVNPSLSIDSFSLKYDDMKINLDCVSCTTPQLKMLSEMLQSTLNDTESISSSVERFMKSDLLQNQIDRYQNVANRSCPRHGSFFGSNNNDDQIVEVAQTVQIDEALEAIDQPTTDEIMFISPDDGASVGWRVIIPFLVTGGSIFFLYMINFVIARKRRDRNFRKSLFSSTDEDIVTLYKKQQEEEGYLSDLREHTKSMATSGDIPFVARFLMPFVILGNIALFLSGHLSLGATIDIFGQFIGDEIIIPGFFTFSIMKSIFDAWRAGGYSLSLTIGIFSGIWPYTKQLITLCLWFTPPSIVSVSTRGSIFVWLDTLAKWSMLDIFVLIITISAFRLNIMSPDFLPENFYELNIMVLPMWGLYANMIAQLISQVSSHFIIYYHRCITSKVEKTREKTRHSNIDDSHRDESSVMNIDKLSESVCKHIFRRYRLGSGRMMVRSGTNLFIVLLAMISIVFLAVGCILPSISFEILGIGGLLMEAGNDFEDITRDISLIDMLNILIEEAIYLDSIFQYVGLGTLLVLMVLTSILIPILIISILLSVWFLPMERKTRNRMMGAIDILKAWQYVEVYVLSVIVCTWQLGAVSEYMVNEPYCSGFNDQFALVANLEVVDASDAQCFYNSPELKIGIVYLIVSGVSIAILSSFVEAATKQKHYENDEDQKAKYVEDTITKMHYSTDIKLKTPAVQFSDSFSIFLCLQPKQKELESRISQETQESPPSS